MDNNLPGKDTSLWLDTTLTTDFPSLNGQSLNVDVAVVGGGIAGLLTAWMIQKEGLKTVVVEKSKIIENTTGNTTAKLTSQHNLIYDYLIKEQGLDIAKAYSSANQQAIEDIDALSRMLEIECDFSRRDAYVYTQENKMLKAINAEIEASQKLNLPATFTDKSDLPFAIKGAIKFSEQAQFHPRKFLLGIASNYINIGGLIFEQTEAKDIKPDKKITLQTTRGYIKADFGVVATKYPFWRADIFDKHTWTKLSYALGVKLKDGENHPQGMYINADSPLRTIRSHPYAEGEILIFGGESHNSTKNFNKNEHYKNLIEDVKKLFKVDSIIYRWIAGDMMPYDRMPYIGNLPNESKVFVITGFHAWGLAWAIVAAEMITDQIKGTPNPLRDIFGLARLAK